MTYIELLVSIDLIVQASSRSALVPLPPMSWNILKESGSQYKLTLEKFSKEGESPDAMERIHPPSSIVIEVDVNATTIEVNDLLSSTIGGKEGIHIGIIEGPEGNDDWKMVMISPLARSDEKGMDNPGSKISRSFEEMMNSIDNFDMTPDTMI